MPNFVYKAVGQDGRTVENVIVAPTEQDVINHLQKLQLVPVQIRQAEEKRRGKASLRTIKTKDVVLFTKQLRTLLKSGVPILVSLNAIKEQNSDPAFQALVEALAEEIESGNAFSAALAQFPKIFPSIYVNSVKVGELSGSLEDTLLYLYQYLEEEEKIRKNVKKALRYPMLVIMGLVGAFVVFTTVVIPNFIPIFQSAGVELPLPTRILINTYYIFSNYGILVFLGVVGLIAGLYFYGKTPRGKYQLDKLKLNLPIIGQLLRKVNISRFAKVLYTMNRTGIPVVKAFETLQANADNMVYKEEIGLILERIKAGEGIANSMRKSAYFSSFVVEMISIGEKSGALDEMLASVTEYYDMEVNESVANMTAMIEPIVSVGLGGMVLIMAMAIFLPMWDMMNLAQ
ncbi:MAG: type II secretion system F family protein [Calditrichia bacterium]